MAAVSLTSVLERITSPDIEQHSVNKLITSVSMVNCGLSFRDRGNTAVNVLGDCLGVALVEHLSRKDLEEMDELGQYEVV